MIRRSMPIYAMLYDSIVCSLSKVLENMRPMQTQIRLIKCPKVGFLAATLNNDSLHLKHAQTYTTKRLVF